MCGLQVNIFRKNLKSKIKSIISQAECCFSQSDKNEILDIYNCHYKNVDILCSFLDDESCEVVVLKLKNGGFISPHKHKVEKKICVVNGQYRDPVTNIDYKEGTIQKIQPNQLHGFLSDSCILTILTQSKS
jgi:hypothetical protein